MGCKCCRSDDPGEMSLHPTRKNSSSAVQSETTVAFSSSPVQDAIAVQSALRCYLACKSATKALTSMTVLTPSTERDAIEHLAKTPLRSIPDILTEAAKVKLAQLPPFEYPIRVVGGDYAGPVVLSDGSVYDGQWREGKRLGKGRYFTSSGGLLQGIWNNGLHIYGRVVYPNGDHYEGEYIHMRRHGSGTFQSLYCTIEYKGTWKHDKKHGFGCEKLADGCQYEGYFEEDMRHGEGQLIKSNGDVYIGGFKQGKQSGYGKWTRQDGKRYEGEWEEGVIQGKGTLISKDKAYTGQFVQGKKEGMGVLTWGDFKYEGEFAGNKMHGKGEISLQGAAPQPCVFVRNKQVAV